jgi:hypothetical protein
MEKIIEKQSAFTITTNNKKLFVGHGSESFWSLTDNIGRALYFYPRSNAEDFIKLIQDENPNSDLNVILPVTITYSINVEGE